MGVELVYTGDDGRNRSVPIATLAFFESTWLRASRELHLTLVPTLMHGTKLDAEGGRALLKELALIKHWSMNKPDAKHQQLRSRVERLQTELQRLIDAGATDFSFG